MPVACVRRSAVGIMLVVLVACSGEQSTAPDSRIDKSVHGGSSSSTVTVTSASPSSATQDTTLDVQVNGSGFDRGSSVTFQLNGTVDARVHVNSTKYVKSTQLVANVTIAADAQVAQYDVVARTSSGLKGIGSEMFTVLLNPEVLSGGARAVSVNANGDALGQSPGNPPSAILWPATGGAITLPSGSFPTAGAENINASGLVLVSLTGGAPDARGIETPSNGTYTVQEVPPAPGGIHPIGTGLNDVGQMVGWHEQSPNLYWWTASTGWVLMQSPAGADLCGVFSRPINNNGAIVAVCRINGIRTAFYYSDHTAAPVQLPRPAGWTGEVWADGINSAGVIAGYEIGGHALVWTPDGAGGFTLQLLPDIGWGANANSIGEDGTIAGSVGKSAVNSYPAIWLPNGTLQILGMPSRASSASANDVAMTPNGLVVVGEGSGFALRWRAGSP